MEVLLAGQPLVQGQLLRQDPDHPLHRQQLPLEGMALDRGLSFRRAEQAGEHLDRGALAGAVRTQEAEEAAPGHPEGDVVHGGPAPKDLGEVADDDGIARCGGLRRYLRPAAGMRAMGRLRPTTGAITRSSPISVSNWCG